MLTALRIQNFAVIEEAELTLSAGLTVVTGETGAGKSLVVDALALLFGERADADSVRAEAEEATVEGLFQVNAELRKRLEALGLPDMGEELSVRRLVHRSGRSKVYVNGALVTVGVLCQLLRGTYELSGQHDSMAIFDPQRQLALLDRSGPTDAERAAYRESFERLTELRHQLAALGGDAAAAQQRLDFVRFQLEELERLAPKAGEEASLENERRRLSSAQKLASAASNAETLLEGAESSVGDQLGRARSLIADAARLDDTLMPLCTRLDGLAAEVGDVARELMRYGRRIEDDPRRLAELEERWASLRRLSRKHNTDAAGLVAKGQALAAECEALERRSEVRAELETHIEAAEKSAWVAANALSQARRTAAQTLGNAIRRELSALAMPNAVFEAALTPLGELTGEGADALEMRFSANTGEPPRALARVASGGEASRLMLALRSHLADVDGAGGYVFDEVDAGVGGAVADLVGHLLKTLSRRRPVLCVTHVPQVAAYADAHWVLQKQTQQGRTRTRLVALEPGITRSQELARMLSGTEVSQEALGAAEALVRAAHARSRPVRAVPTPPGRARKSA